MKHLALLPVLSLALLLTARAEDPATNAPADAPFTIKYALDRAFLH